MFNYPDFILWIPQQKLSPAGGGRSASKPGRGWTMIQLNNPSHVQLPWFYFVNSSAKAIPRWRGVLCFEARQGVDWIHLPNYNCLFWPVIFKMYLKKRLVFCYCLFVHPLQFTLPGSPRQRGTSSICRLQLRMVNSAAPCKTLRKIYFKLSGVVLRSPAGGGLWFN